MKYSIMFSSCVLAIAVSAAVQAEIYESTDSSGNPVFTDTPSPGAEKVDLPEENIADAVTPRPETAVPEPEAPSRAPTPTRHPDQTVIIHDNRNDELETEREYGGRHEVGDIDNGRVRPGPDLDKRPGDGPIDRPAVVRPHVGGHKR